MSERGAWELRLGGYAKAVDARLQRWQQKGFGARLWEKDHALWSSKPVQELTDRLGWLALPTSMAGEIGGFVRFADQARSEGFRHAAVLGMGGSSLAPEVFARTFGSDAGSPVLTVLDSTHPAAVRDAAERLEPTWTLFLVSSKSGTTTETLSLFRFFWERALRGGPAEEAGRHFVAITDAGTPLERLARERGFRAVFHAPEDVGGRYSALTAFGLVPAALIGVDVAGLLGRGRAMAEACGPGVPAAHNPGLVLGAVLGELARAGRDKVTFVASPSLASFPDWLEQLLAESTGKSGQGIVPVVGEPLGPPAVYGADRFFVAFLLGREADGAIEDRLAALEREGHPVALFRLVDPMELGDEIFRWEVATAAAGAVLGVNPFDQPDVGLAKELANRAVEERGAPDQPRESGAAEVRALDVAAIGRALAAWLDGAEPGGYLGVQAYLPARPETERRLRRIQAALRDRTRLATTLGYGPRFLHSTGQLHKGGPESGRFLQIVDEPPAELDVPEAGYSFGTLIRAQADGDRGALRGRRVLRVQLGTDAVGGLAKLQAALETEPPAP